MSYECYCSVALPTMPWVSLKCVIVVFPDHTHLLFEAWFTFKLAFLSKNEHISMTIEHIHLNKYDFYSSK